MNEIGTKTQLFQRIVEPLMCNYMVENDMEGKDSIGVLEKEVETTRIQLVFLLAHNCHCLVQQSSLQ